MKTKTLLSIILILIGATLLINSQTPILGAVTGLKNLTPNVSLIAGLVFIVAGIIVYYEEYSEEHRQKPHFRGHDSQRRHNQEARYAARQEYRRIHGKNPTRQELKEFIRGPHERGELSDLVKRIKKSKK